MSPKDPRAHRGPCQPCRRSRLLVSPLPTPSVPTPLPTAALPYWSATSPSTGAPAPLAAFGVRHIVVGVVVGLPSFFPRWGLQRGRLWGRQGGSQVCLQHCSLSCSRRRLWLCSQPSSPAASPRQSFVGAWKMQMSRKRCLTVTPSLLLDAALGAQGSICLA